MKLLAKMILLPLCLVACEQSVVSVAPEVREVHTYTFDLGGKDLLSCSHCADFMQEEAFRLLPNLHGAYPDYENDTLALSYLIEDIDALDMALVEAVTGLTAEELVLLSEEQEILQ